VNVKTFLKLLGLLITAVGLALGFAERKGWFKDPARAELLKWVLEAPQGLPLESPAAVAFRTKFPPPADSNADDLTHLTKQVIRSEHGPVMMASVNYMHRDGSRTAYVATLDDIRSWATETRYRWLPWITTLVGFAIVVITFIVELMEPSKV
jgi:hypothetical protein